MFEVITFVVGAGIVLVWAYAGWPRERRFYQTSPKLSPAELRAAFNVPDSNRLWIGTLQLIEDVRLEAQEAAQKSVANHGICASCVGGDEFLTRLRDRLMLEREAAIKQAA